MTAPAALAVICLGLVLMGLACALLRTEAQARKYRRLVDAAGSEELAELAIGQVRDERLLREALLMKRAMKAYRGNVLRFPKITDRASRGRPVHFEGPGAA